MVGALCSGGRGKGGRELGRLLPQRGKRNRWLPPTTTRNCFTGHLRGAERRGGIAATSSDTVPTGREWANKSAYAKLDYASSLFAFADHTLSD